MHKTRYFGSNLNVSHTKKKQKPTAFANSRPFWYISAGHSLHILAACEHFRFSMFRSRGSLHGTLHIIVSRNIKALGIRCHPGISHSAVYSLLWKPHVGALYSFLEMNEHSWKCCDEDLGLEIEDPWGTNVMYSLLSGLCMLTPRVTNAK